ncbi:hypothetical protein GCM10023201_22220 [Actinomycetospora corticicola]|uniref:Putative OsmC-like protein n=1 Tax=Actinomycetospora corticicola TaxID=663602 RepID=A0A7Y9J3W0_9PSEU|nr:OsmC family protein [Actinomycetospora corticicola]NYD34059.1 putative OsmC-like protein [Actinomycetospora corticicola]
MAIKPKETVVPFPVHAEGTGVYQTLTAGGEGGHVFHTDAYPAFGGKDSAPSPLFYLLGALTSCNQVTGSLVAKDLGITVTKWTFDIVGDLDTAVFVGGADGNANFDRVEVRATVETDATEEQFEQFVSEVARRCPVTQMFTRSGLEFDNRWTRVEATATV